MSKWRVEKMCANCPFQSSGPGLRLRRTLRRARWAEITGGLLRGSIFECHKTTKNDDEDDEPIPGSGLVCAGSIEWQAKRAASRPIYSASCRRSTTTAHGGKA